VLIENIMTCAVLGTERAGVLQFSSTGLDGGLLSSLEQDDRETYLLNAAAVVLLQRRAGYIPAKNSSSLPNPCPKESLTDCGKGMSGLIREAIGGQFRSVFPEALQLIRARRQRISFFLLVDILNAGVAQKNLQVSISEVVGERGKWLASQNEQWSYACLVTSTAVTAALNNDASSLFSIWSTASRAEQSALLSEMRIYCSDTALAVLQSTWKDETAAGRIEIIKCFTSNPKIEEEPFLNNALDDKSIEVRRIAQKILTTIPGSRFSQRILAVVSQFIRFDKHVFGGIGISVTIPQTFDPEWKNYGIDESSWIKDVGDRAWWFIQWISLVPPEHWTTITNETPASLLRLADKSEWSDAIIIGWTKAAALSSDTDWKLAILQHWSRSNDQRTSLSGLFPSINDLADKADDLIIERLDRDIESLHDNHSALPLLQQYTNVWSDNLSRRVIKSIQRTCRQTVKTPQPTWHTRALLKSAALRVSPMLADDFENGWPVIDKTRDEWKSAVDEFTQLLRFRHNLYKEMSYE